MTRLGQMLIEDGFEKGLEKGIEEGLEKGMEKGLEKGKTRENEDMRSLLRKLLDSDRMDDLKKASEDAAYCMKLKEEFNI